MRPILVRPARRFARPLAGPLAPMPMRRRRRRIRRRRGLLVGLLALLGRGS